MATYKVIQDIEAEDKFIGPLTLKQFVFAAITVICLYLAFILYSKHAWPLALVLLPPAFASGFLGFPWKRDQPTETWLIAKLRFFFKPRKRNWDQSGLKQLVTITVPKKIEKHLTNELGQEEVRSRLKALANTIDSRGWVIKNVEASAYTQPSFMNQGDTSDRLVGVSALPQAVPTLDGNAADDMLDVVNNPVAHQLESMIGASTQNYRQQLVERMREANNDPTPAVALAATPSLAQTAAPINVSAGITPSAPQPPVSATQHLPTIQPLAAQPAPAAPVTSPVNPAILGLAKNDDLNVATLARQAQRETEKQLGDDEVVISLR